MIHQELLPGKKPTIHVITITDIKILNNGYLYLTGDSVGVNYDSYCSTLKIAAASGTLDLVSKIQSKDHIAGNFRLMLRVMPT